MSKPCVRVATRADLVEFYKRDTLGPSHTSWCGAIDGKVVAVAGLSYKSGYVAVFADISPRAKAFPHTLHRHALRLIRDALRRHRYIFAEANTEEPGAERWLTRLGFEKIGNGTLWRISRRDL